MEYKIVFATTADRYSAEHKSIVVTSSALSRKIATLQAQGRIIVSVTRVSD